MTQRQFGVGAVTVDRYMLVAWKGKSILKQWGVDRTFEEGWLSFEYTKCLAGTKSIAQDYWPDAKKLGADRLCATLIEHTWQSGTPGAGTFPGEKGTCGTICYDGKTFTQGVHTENKPTVTCPPGQAPYQHPDGSWGCAMTPPWGSPAQCPPGQHWSAPLKKCVPYKLPTPPTQPAPPTRSPYNRGGFMQVHGVDSEVNWDSENIRGIVAGVDGLEVAYERGDGTLGAVKLPYRAQQPRVPQPFTPAHPTAPVPGGPHEVVSTFQIWGCGAYAKTQPPGPGTQMTWDKIPTYYYTPTCVQIGQHFQATLTQAKQKLMGIPVANKADANGYWVGWNVLVQLEGQVPKTIASNPPGYSF